MCVLEFEKIFKNASSSKTSTYTTTNTIDSDVYNLFKQFDRDNSGYLTVSELKQALAKAGYIFSDAEIARFVSSIDVNNDGKLSLNGTFVYFYSKIINK